MTESVRRPSGPPGSFFRRKTKDRSASGRSNGETSVHSNSKASYSLPDLGVEKFSVDYDGVALVPAKDDDQLSAESSWHLVDSPSRQKSSIDQGSRGQFHRPFAASTTNDTTTRGKRAPLPSHFVTTSDSILDRPVMSCFNVSRARKKPNQLNVMVAGRCGSGKTSLANLLLGVHEHDRLQEHLLGLRIKASKTPEATFAGSPTSHFDERSFELTLTSPYASSSGRASRYSTATRSSKRETRLKMTIIDTPGLVTDDPLEIERSLGGLLRMIGSRHERALAAETKIQRQPSDQSEGLVDLGESPRLISKLRGSLIAQWFTHSMPERCSYRCVALPQSLAFLQAILPSRHSLCVCR